MKAAYYERPGSAADVLVIGNLPDPEPSFGEVRVKVVFSGLNPTDIETRTGFAGRPMPFPRIVPHQDGAGIIDKVGDTDIACLAPSGVVTAYATDDPHAKLTMPFLRSMFGGYAVRFVFLYTIPHRAFQDAVDEVSACAASGAYQPKIGLTLPLEKIADAHLAQEGGRVVGKILLSIHS